MTVLNVYAPKLAKERAKIWRDLADLEIKGERCVMGDFNMVKSKRNSKGDFCSLMWL